MGFKTERTESGSDSRNKFYRHLDNDFENSSEIDLTKSGYPKKLTKFLVFRKQARMVTGSLREHFHRKRMFYRWVYAILLGTMLVGSASLPNGRINQAFFQKTTQNVSQPKTDSKSDYKSLNHQLNVMAFKQTIKITFSVGPKVSKSTSKPMQDELNQIKTKEKLLPTVEQDKLNEKIEKRQNWINYYTDDK